MLIQDQTTKNIKTINTVNNSSRNLKNRVGKTLHIPIVPSLAGSEIKMKVMKDPDPHTAPWFGSHGDFQKRHSKM